MKLRRVSVSLLIALPLLIFFAPVWYPFVEGDENSIWRFQIHLRKTQDERRPSLDDVQESLIAEL